MVRLKCWKKRNNKWINKKEKHSVNRIQIKKPKVSAWGKYQVQGIRADGMKLSLNALDFKELNTKPQALKYVKSYMKNNDKC